MRWRTTTLSGHLSRFWESSKAPHTAWCWGPQHHLSMVLGPHWFGAVPCRHEEPAPRLGSVSSCSRRLCCLAQHRCALKLPPSKHTAMVTPQAGRAQQKHSCLKLTYKYAAMREYEVTHIVRLNHFLWEWVKIVALPGKLWHHLQKDQDFTWNLHKRDFSDQDESMEISVMFDKKGWKKRRTLRKWTTLPPLAQANDFRARWSWFIG